MEFEEPKGRQTVPFYPAPRVIMEVNAQVNGVFSVFCSLKEEGDVICLWTQAAKSPPNFCTSPTLFLHESAPAIDHLCVLLVGQGQKNDLWME